MGRKKTDGKIVIIGAGYVGASIAYALMLKEFVQSIVLVDCNEARVCSEALDIRHGLSFMGTANVSVGSYEDCADADMIVITAGRNRLKGENRLELANDNINIVQEVCRELKKHYTSGIVLTVTNPADIITHMVTEWMSLPDGMVFSSGCLLDTSRFLRILADHFDLRTDLISGMIVGEHGDAQFPVWSKTMVSGIPIGEFCALRGLPWGEEQKQKIAGQVKTMGADIIAGKGRTHYSIATCVCYLAEAVLGDKPMIASVSSMLRGEFGLSDVCLSVPTLIGSGGVLKRLEEQLEDDEKKHLKQVAQRLLDVRRNIKDICSVNSQG